PLPDNPKGRRYLNTASTLGVLRPSSAAPASPTPAPAAQSLCRNVVRDNNHSSIMLSMTKRSGKRRLAEADRTQVRVLMVDPDGLVPDDDPVRAVWSFVERLDLSAFYEPIKAFEGTPGRPPIDPKILMALWIQATLDGIGSAREVARMCEMHARYQWICGGVTPGYHRLSDFRSNSERSEER